ncbi:MAG TPA: hypothetical protein VGB13_10635, partial [Candidatus Krumholzibacteria bacterium]
MSNALQPGIDEARLDGITRTPLPGSRRIYATGTLYPFLRVPMREIHQARDRAESRRLAYTRRRAGS